MTKNMRKAVMVCGASVLLLWTVNGCQKKQQPAAAVESPALSAPQANQPMHLAELDGLTIHDGDANLAASAPAKDAQCNADCKSKKAARVADHTDGGMFYAPHEVPATLQISQAMRASGARNDSTFNAIHFDGGKLNSLGEAKIDALLADDDTAEPVVFHLNIAEADPFKTNRQDAIVEYCKARGMNESQLQFKLGANPATYSPSAEILTGLKKLEAPAGASSGEGAGVSMTPTGN